MDIHRNLSKVFSVKDSLVNSSYKTELTTFNTNADWEALPANRQPFIKIVDCYYGDVANGGSKLVNITQLAFWEALPANRQPYI